jgi:hypothetical protein
MRWDVCGVRITRVVEFVMPFPVDFFAEATSADVAAEAWLVPDFVNADGYYLMRYVVHRRHPPIAASTARR